MTLIVSYSGIRGLVGTDLDESVAARYGRAFGELVRRRHRAPRILLGRDTRLSGPDLQRGLIEGLSPYGALVDLGIVTTPTLQHALGALDAQAAVGVTASHNPDQYNGIKLFMAPENTVLDGSQMRELQLLVDRDARGMLTPTAAARPIDAPATAALEDWHDRALRAHLDAVQAQIDVAGVRGRAFRVAVDSGSGAGEEITRALLEDLGCAVVEVHSPRGSEPVVEALGALREAVVRDKCDLGVAQDLDADRLVLIDERGEAPGEELTLVLAVDHLLTRSAQPGTVVVKNVSTTRAVDEIAFRHQAVLVQTAVGEVNLSRALAAAIAAGHRAFGGEGNGGVIHPAVAMGRDSLVGIALILERLLVDPRPLSAHVAAMPRYHGRKERLPMADRTTLESRLTDVEAAFPNAQPSRVDGLRLHFADGSWLLIRASNTEPIIRVVAESPSPERVDDILARVRQLFSADA